MIDMVHAVLPTSCTFEVQKDDEFEGLVVEEMDDKKCCIVHARLRCDVEMGGKQSSASFSLSLKDMSVCMRGVSSHYIMEMSKPVDSEEVHILSKDAVTDAKINACTLKTLCDDYSKASMKQMEYDYTVRIDLPVFRSIVKMAKDLGADKLEFKVYKKKAEDNGSIVFCLRANGSSETTHYFPSSASESGEEGNVFSATNTSENVDDLEDRSKWEVAYSDTFGISYLTTFIRSMDRQVVTLRISPNQPLIVIFPLGGDDSYVCYILAPKEEDD